MAASNSTVVSVLDYSSRDAKPAATVHMRRLLNRILTNQGPSGLARMLYVPMECASRLKHRVACVTCRSRLDAMVASLAAEGAPPGASQEQQHPATPPVDASSGTYQGGPSPLAKWLAADAGLGLAPAAHPLGDLDTLAGFLATFTSSSSDDLGDDPSRRGGRSNGVVRCPYHARGPVASVRQATAAASGAVNLTPAQQRQEREREHDRTVGLLYSGMREADWELLGSIDVDDTLADLFMWLSERGRCGCCVDVVTGALLHLGRQQLDHCMSCAASSINAPEFLRVQGKLRHVCGVYQLQPDTFNGRPAYKKDRTGMTRRKEIQDAYIIHTALGDWMISGQMDAGGAKCEGWVYAMDAALTPDKVCTTWKMSSMAGWEEDPTLCITPFETLPEDFQAAIGYEDGSYMFKHLACEERGMLLVPLENADVLNEVLRSPTDIAPMRTKAGDCQHVNTPEAAQSELYGWLRWLLRERLERQRQNILAIAQVSHQLCRLYACAALQQLEQADEQLPQAGKGEEKGEEKEKKRLRKGQQGKRKAERARNSKEQRTSPLRALHATDSDGSASTRASSEEPPEVHRGLATRTRTLMQEMGWESESENKAALDNSEIEDWLHQHPGYRQAVQEGRQRLQNRFEAWAVATSL